MQGSIWSGTLTLFREKAAGRDAVPAGVAISAVSASLALALIAKVIEINRRRGVDIGDLLDKTRRESDLLAQLADADVVAFSGYLDCKRRNLPADEPMREAIRIPIEAARSAIRGVDLCREAKASCRSGMPAADLEAAESLLLGAARAILHSAEANLRNLPEHDLFRLEIAAELPRMRTRL